MAERPVECSHCKKPVKVLYKEIVGDSTLCLEMCADCPVLQQKLHGGLTPARTAEGLPEGTAGLCCGNCRTTLESVKMGNPLGCAACYEVFSEVLAGELAALNKMPPRTQKTLAARRNQPLHMGKSPAAPAVLTPSSRLTSLNEALNEALRRENYEQAAWLRDQIKALTEQRDERKS
jgi:protein arginine kinase activator